MLTSKLPKKASGAMSLTDPTLLSLDDLFDLQQAADMLLCSVCKVNTVKPTLEAERKMSNTIIKSWKAAARSALGEELTTLLGKRFNRVNINQFIRALGIKLSAPLSREQQQVIKGRIRQIWRSAKQLTSRSVGVKFSFTQRDRRAITAINRQQVFWVNNFYSDHLSDRIRAVSNDVLLQQGLGRREAGKALRQALQQEFGLKPGGKSPFALEVPARYAGNPDLYFEGVASTSSHQARTFGKMTAFDQAEVKAFRLVNPDDERTGVICQQMSGQEFTVASGVKQMNDVLGAKDPADVKNIAPWLSGQQIKDALDGAKTGSRQATARLENAKIILPPFHAFCRTEPVAIN